MPLFSGRKGSTKQPINKEKRPSPARCLFAFVCLFDSDLPTAATITTTRAHPTKNGEGGGGGGGEITVKRNKSKTKGWRKGGRSPSAPPLPPLSPLLLGAATQRDPPLAAQHPQIPHNDNNAATRSPPAPPPKARVGSLQAGYPRVEGRQSSARGSPPHMHFLGVGWG